MRFRACSGPGPSGARPEHLRELSACRDRRAASRLLRAIAVFSEEATSGRLCAEARWILESRLVFLRKKRGAAPRPIRVGELWRRVVAKKLIHAHRETIQERCLAARQFGVGVPAGTNALVHWRIVLEKLLEEGCGRFDGDPLAVIDVDLQNAFPS